MFLAHKKEKKKPEREQDLPPSPVRNLVYTHERRLRASGAFDITASRRCKQGRRYHLLDEDAVLPRRIKKARKAPDMIDEPTERSTGAKAS